MKNMCGGKSRKFARLFFLMNVFFLFVLLATTSCSADKSSSLWEALPTIEADPVEQDLDLVWASDGSPDDMIEVMTFIEPFCRSNVCLDYHADVLAYLAENENVYLRIYDYPISQDAKSFMLSATGNCILQSDENLYFEFLAGASEISDRYDNNLEIQLLAKDLLGEYDRSCVRKEVREIKAHFENQNPLDLQAVPATVINGRVIYGNVSLDDLELLIAFLKD